MRENWIEKNECICSCWKGLGVLIITLPSNGGSWIGGDLCCSDAVLHSLPPACKHEKQGAAPRETVREAMCGDDLQCQVHLDDRGPKATSSPHPSGAAGRVPAGSPAGGCAPIY